MICISQIISISAVHSAGECTGQLWSLSTSGTGSRPPRISNFIRIRLLAWERKVGKESCRFVNWLTTEAFQGFADPPTESSALPRTIAVYSAHLSHARFNLPLGHFTQGTARGQK
jgi:hypothetical protein